MTIKVGSIDATTSKAIIMEAMAHLAQQFTDLVTRLAPLLGAVAPGSESDWCLKTQRPAAQHFFARAL